MPSGSSAYDRPLLSLVDHDTAQSVSVQTEAGCRLDRALDAEQLQGMMFVIPAHARTTLTIDSS